MATLSSSHTPGPWEQAGLIIWHHGEEGAVICQMVEPNPKSGLVEAERLQLGSDGWKLQEANARLIAAAPDLLETIKELCAYLYATRNPGSLPESYRAACRLIDKAEGRA
jgi:hypothetical protein